MMNSETGRLRKLLSGILGVFMMVTLVATNFGGVVSTRVLADHLCPSECTWGEPSYTFTPDYSTCTAMHYCVINNTHFQGETVYTTSEETRPATCTSMGQHTYSATFEHFPGYSETVDDIPLAAHTLTEEPRVEPTTTTPGHVAGWTCSVCHKHFTDNTAATEITEENWVIPATVVNPPAPAPGPAPAPSTPEKTESPHEHSFSWKVIQEATATADGVEAYICDGCGAENGRRSISAAGIFQVETIGKIKNAPKNGKITLDMVPWNSFGVGIRDALLARPDVSLTVSFLSDGYKGIPLKVTIPAGTDVSKLFDKNGFLGLCHAGTVLGYDK